MFAASVKKLVYCCVAVIILTSCTQKTQTQIVDQDKKPIIITVDAKGQVYLQEGRVMPEDMASKLKAINSNPDAQIFLRGDKDVSYARIMEISGIVSAAGYKKISLVANLPKPMTMKEADVLRRQIESCWNVPVGSQEAINTRINLSIDVNSDRTVRNIDIVDKSRYASDPFFRTVADSAVRAVRNPRCSPLALPADEYEQWKHIDFTFDPRDIL